MATCQFLFDVVVSHFDAPELQITDPKKLEVLAQFNNKPVLITSSRINVSEFDPNNSLEINALPKKLRKTLEECGMPITIKYNGKVVGIGQINLPQMVIDRIDEGMSDLMHVESCNIERDADIVGRLEVLFRVVIKCAEQPNVVSVCKDMDRSIAQQDIMFIMAESQRCPSPCDPCLDALEPDEGDERLKLDLQRYRSFTDALNSDRVFTHRPAGNSACCEIKKMAQQCEDIVDSITKAAGHPKPLKAPCRNPEDPDSPCLITDIYPIEENPLTSPNFPCFSYLPARVGEPPDYCNPNVIPVPISELEKPMIRPSRFCPICLTNMSWMPRFASCPTCGVKPMPVIEERHKEKRLTAEDVLHEFLGKPKGADENYCVDLCNKQPDETKEGDDHTECRCTCKNGKVCAHCRIRKLVADIFQATKNEQICPKVKPESSEDFCVLDTDTVECRPYLARVFSELRDLYNLKDTVRTEDFEKPTSRLPPQKKAHPEKLKIVPRQEQKRIIPRTHKAVERIPKKFEAGHKFCVNPTGPVARNQGWAWHLRTEAHKLGWRPGSVKKSVKKIMNFFTKYSPENSPKNVCAREKENEREQERQMPTLNVCKKQGEIFVTLRPLNDPNITMNPIVFKIVKSNLAMVMSRIKRKLKDKGFPKCTCHQTLMMCVCRDNAEKKILENAVGKESRRYGIESCVDNFVFTDTSDSEMEFDFDVTPPAGTGKYIRNKSNRRLLNHSTQTMGKSDLKVTPRFPLPVNPYTRTYDCAAGDRYTGTALGAPGEVVYEDGVFGFRGGGPHGVPAAPGGAGARPKSAGIWGAKPGGPMIGGGRAGAGTGGVGGGGGGRGGHGGRGGGPGGFGGFGGGAFGGKSFPGAKRDPASRTKSPPIPVRMQQRFYKAVAAAKKAEKEAQKHAKEKKKQGTHLIRYLEEKGAVPTPWDPNIPNPPLKPEEIAKLRPVGSDGLTKSQRKQRMLLLMPIPPLDTMPRLGKCPGECYNTCQSTCCYPCGYNC